MRRAAFELGTSPQIHDIHIFLNFRWHRISPCMCISDIIIFDNGAKKLFIFNTKNLEMSNRLLYFVLRACVYSPHNLRWYSPHETFSNQIRIRMYA